MVDFYKARVVLCVSELGSREGFVALATFNQGLGAGIFEMVAQFLRTIEQNVTIVAESSLWALLAIMVTKLQDIHTLRFSFLSRSHDPATLWINTTPRGFRGLDNDLLFNRNLLRLPVLKRSIVQEPLNVLVNQIRIMFVH